MWKKGKSCSVVSDSMRPCGMQPTRLLCSWNSPGKNTGVGSHSLHQGTFLTQGANLSLLQCSQIFYHLIHQGSPTSEEPNTEDYILDNSIYVKFRDLPKLTRSDGNQNSGQLWELWSWSWRAGNVPYPDVSIDGRYKNVKSCHNIHIRLVHFTE